ncbi:MAG: periplasmic heavy metal sensor [Betaproteobacteria bacterium]|nr:MAG: periplasmic heavy metal sensor [Betaproteobacteria bacterium]
MLDVDNYVRQLRHFFLVSAGQLYITLLIGQIPLTRCCETPLPGEMFPVTRKGRIMETQDRNPEKRRRFFKRAAIATLIGGIAAGIGIKAFAQGGGCGWHRGGFAAGPLDPAQVDEHVDRMLKHLYVEIDATEEQKQKLAPIVKQAAKDLLPLRERIREARGKALELLTQDSVDRTAIEALRAEHLQLAEQASRRIVQALGDAAEVLTPAQRKELAARVEKHRGWRHG